jgi:hypothetical protein
MPTAFAEKLDTGPRFALRAAIKTAWQATSAVTKAEDDLQRTEVLIADFEIELAKSVAAVAEAVALDGQQAAQSIADREDLGAPRARQKAEQRQAAAEEKIDMARSALPELKRQLRDKRLAAAAARNNVCIERNRLLAPVAAATLARIKAAEMQMLKDRVLLAAIISDHGAPEYPRDPDAFFQSRSADAARRQPFTAIWAEAAADAADLAVVPYARSVEGAEQVVKVHGKWLQQLATLLEDPDAELPENE